MTKKEEDALVAKSALILYAEAGERSENLPPLVNTWGIFVILSLVSNKSSDAHVPDHRHKKERSLLCLRRSRRRCHVSSGCGQNPGGGCPSQC